MNFISFKCQSKAPRGALWCSGKMSYSRSRVSQMAGFPSGHHRVATHYLYQNSLTFSWLFPDFSPFSSYFWRPASSPHSCPQPPNLPLIWVLQPFQEYFTYIELIVHQRLKENPDRSSKVKREPGGKKQIFQQSTYFQRIKQSFNKRMRPFL